MAYRLLIFDFDGTLADSADWFRYGLNHASRRYGFPSLDEETFARLRGHDNRTIIRHLGVPAWKIPLIARHLRRLVATEADRIRLFDGAVELLHELHRRGARLAIVSSNTEPVIRQILGPRTAALVHDYGCGVSLFGKARTFRKVVARSGIPAGQTLCIGDEVRYIEAAAKAGLDSGMVAWGYATPDLLRARGPTLFFDSMDQIAALLPGTDIAA